MDDDQFDDEVNNLIEWCEDLDFDKYCEGWLSMATSAKPQLPTDDNNVQVYGLGLGDITIGLGANSFSEGQMASGGLGVSDLGVKPGTFNHGLSTQVTHNEIQPSHLSVKGAGAVINDKDSTQHNTLQVSKMQQSQAQS